ncbi:MAG: hypothetical protein P8Y10_16360 [Gemmatimonadales bacterium]
MTDRRTGRAGWEDLTARLAHLPADRWLGTVTLDSREELVLEVAAEDVP